MARKKNKKEVKNDEKAAEYKRILANKKIPILTLDTRWHELFPEHEKTPEIKRLEILLNKLLQQQGKLTNDAKDMVKLKKKLMSEILNNMEEEKEEEANNFRLKKQSKSQELILEINEKIKESDNALLMIPYEIQRVNQELLIESMIICYEKFRINEEQMEQIDEWVDRAREELKKRLLRRQDMEMQNEAMYSYLHNLLGFEVMNIFDKNNGEY